MNIINSLNEFTIYQDRKKPTLFCIKNNYTNNNHSLSLFYSIININIVNSSNIINDNNDYSLIIKASSIKSFAQFKKEQKIKNDMNQLPHIIILMLINSLTKQLHYLLKKESKCFYTFTTDNIIVIDDCKFLYLSNEHLKEVKNNNIAHFRISSAENVFPLSLKDNKIYYFLKRCLHHNSNKRYLLYV